MKREGVFAFALLLTVFISDASAANDKRYAIKSGIVEYKLSGIQEGTETLYFADWGRKEGRHRNTTTKFMGISQNVEDINYIDGEWSYNYDKKTNTATKVNFKEFLEAAHDMKGKQSMRDFGEKMMKDLGGKKIGNKKILGKTCEEWEIASYMTKTCIYKNSVPLEMSSNVAGMQMYQVAVKFQENAKIPADKITVPKTAIIEDMGDLQNLANQRQAFPAQAADGQDIESLGDVFKMMGQMQQQQQEAMQAANVNQDQQQLSQRELELKEKELELKRMELELQQQQLQQQAQSDQQTQEKSALNQANDAVNTTNKITNTFRGVKSLFGR